MVGYCYAPTGAHGQRDQELLEHSSEEEADPDGIRPHDSSAPHRHILQPPPSHSLGQPQGSHRQPYLGRPGHAPPNRSPSDVSPQPLPTLHSPALAAAAVSAKRRRPPRTHPLQLAQGYHLRFDPPGNAAG